MAGHGDVIPVVVRPRVFYLLDLCLSARMFLPVGFRQSLVELVNGDRGAALQGIYTIKFDKIFL